MAITTRTDPLRNFKFRVQISPNGERLRSLTAGLSDIGFAQMSGIAVTNEVIPYREGGMNTHPHKMVGQSDFAPVSMARGVFPDQNQMYMWQQFIHSWQGGVVGGAGNDAGEPSDYRANVVISVYDHPVTASGYQYDTDPTAAVSVALPERLTITLYNAWPGSFSVSDLNAGDNGILIQQMQLHHEGFSVAYSPESTT